MSFFIFFLTRENGFFFLIARTIMNLSIGSEVIEQRRFELVMQVRDNQGKLTGRTKSIQTDNAADLETFFIRNSVVKKKKKKPGAAAKTSAEINQALQAIEKHVTEKKNDN